ncbi:hypothetical protein [Thermococcus henrietii]|uniref:hypothetical protein n=1 Tax=Thermococcus henrietii TaxID=2016361 RepID=UPI000C0740A9|nr:hypothetical protein [Thermococcus henrietii]
MNIRGLITLHFKTTLRDSLFGIVLVGLLVWAFSSKSVPKEFTGQENFTFYTLFTMMLVGYAVMVAISFTSMIKRKTARFYHLLLVMPGRLPKHVFFELLPSLLLGEIASIAVGLVMYMNTENASPTWLFLPVIGSSLFVFGLSMVSMVVVLQVSNVRLINIIMFILLFVLARVPKYLLEHGYSISVATNVMMLIALGVAVLGPLALSSINTERVLLAS